METIEFIIVIFGCLYSIGKAMDLCADNALNSREQIAKRLDRIERRISDNEDRVFIPDHPMFVEKE